MADIKSEVKTIVTDAVKKLALQKNIDEIDTEKLAVENPPDPKMGDFGCPMFSFAKAFRMAPPQIAQEIVKIIASDASDASTGSTGSPTAGAGLGTFVAVGPYVNLKLEKSNAASDILLKIKNEGEKYGSLGNDGTAPLAGQKVMIEFSSPNTNKPLHLGHLRNDALGESVSRILKKAGAEVYKVDLINNRGIHICKSMLAYKLFHEAKNETPETLGMKGDHFVGQCYVEYDRHSKEHPEAQKQAEEMLVKWEAGDEETRKLWEMMNGWTLDGVKATYERTGIHFDKFYFESETYLKGKNEILKGLEKGIFFKADDGSVRVNVAEAVGKGKDGEDQEKVLLRKDGTSVYITQDIGTAISRHADWPFNQLVYVVATEQNYHFKVLFYILKKLGFDWAEKLHHLAYGLVNLPSGRMKSREGTVVDADDLIDALHEDALKAIKERDREKDLEDADDVAEKVALAALHYYLLQVTPIKDMLFNPEESLSFNGNTGPYLEYMGARITSILKKAESENLKSDSSKDAIALLKTEDEWNLIRKLGDFPETVKKAAENFDPSVVATYLYDVSKLFSKFYQTCPIVGAANENKMLAESRLFLAECTLNVLKSAMDLVLVPFLEKM